MIIIMKSNRVNLSLPFMFLSKDHPFCKNVQLKQDKDETGHRAQTRSLLMPAHRSWSLFTPTGEQGLKTTNITPHDTLDITALLCIPDVRL